MKLITIDDINLEKSTQNNINYFKNMIYWFPTVEYPELKISFNRIEYIKHIYTKNIQMFTIEYVIDKKRSRYFENEKVKYFDGDFNLLKNPFICNRLYIIPVKYVRRPLYVQIKGEYNNLFKVI